MLEELRVRDLGVIDDVTVELGPGMTALTGETGAGKTLMVEALGLLLGGRADPGWCGAGADGALVEAASLVRGASPGGPRTARTRSCWPGRCPRGRSRAWIDGRMATLRRPGRGGGRLVELHGQHQHRALVQPAAQRRPSTSSAGIDSPASQAAAARPSGP